MKKLNLIGGGFQHHLQCSSALNKNKLVEWTLDMSANESVYVDNAIVNSEINGNKENYGWLAESSAIISPVIHEIKSRLDFYFERFKYIFTHDMRLVELDKRFLFTYPNALPWIQQKNVYPKERNISMIASNKTMCPGHNYRQQIIEKYKDQIDHYGRGFFNELPWSYQGLNGEESGKLLALHNYRFSIAMENDNYDMIFCEKLTDCFATGTIPIYWGSKKVVDLFNEDGIIFLDDIDSLDHINEDLYWSKIDAVGDNFERIFRLPSAEDYFCINYLV